jgi:DNA replicative helicase MCM subunit Mcm2 (Cdc46/Mcm family)
MVLMKKLTLAIFISAAMLASAPSAIAKPLGKIENKSPAATAEAIDEAVALVEETLKAIQDDAEKDVVMKLFKTTKQKAKTIESTVTYRIREKALGQLGKARLAYKKGIVEKSEVVALTVKSVDTFKELKKMYHGFGGGKF